jgi:hypothetical protein
MEKDSLLFGLVLGCLVPVLGYAVLEFIFNQLTNLGWLDEVTASTSGQRMRTLILLAICTVLIPFNIAIKNKWDNTVRGIIFPTMIYAGAWLYKFYMELA